MSNYLVIVESPTKVTSIKKYLGSRYKVMASQGHVRDLPKSQIGIDLDQDYEPHYITIRGKGDILSALRKEVNPLLRLPDLPFQIYQAAQELSRVPSFPHSSISEVGTHR